MFKIAFLDGLSFGSVMRCGCTWGSSHYLKAPFMESGVQCPSTKTLLTLKDCVENGAISINRKKFARFRNVLIGKGGSQGTFEHGTRICKDTCAIQPTFSGCSPQFFHIRSKLLFSSVTKKLQNLLSIRIQRLCRCVWKSTLFSDRRTCTWCHVFGRGKGAKQQTPGIWVCFAIYLILKSPKQYPLSKSTWEECGELKL